MSNVITLEEHLEYSGQFFDFIVEFIRRRGVENITNLTPIKYLMRSTCAECSVLPDIAAEFVEAAAADVDAAAEKYRAPLMEFFKSKYPERIAPSSSFKPEHPVRGEIGHPDLPPDWCILHYSNVIAPRSFLAEKELFARALIAVMDEYPEHKVMYTFTWLNSHPKFLAFYPEEWQKNLDKPVDFVSGNLGFHGQFITGCGALNRRAAQYYLDTGELLYKPCRSNCSADALREHLYRNFLSK